MSAELELIYATPSATVYAVIRRKSDAYAWNGSAFEAWDDDNVATYDVALTDKGGDLYQGDMPTDIDAGRYRIAYYVQAGATPAITDTLLESADYTWDGANLASSSEVTISAYALTTLAEVKRYLSITASTYDTILTELINAVTDRVERETGRHFAARDYREWHNGDNTVRLSLREYPVISVNRVAHGELNAMSVAYSGTGIRATVQVTEAAVVLRSIATTGTATTSTLAKATYPTTTLMAAAVSAVTDWTGSSLQNVPTLDLHPLGGQNASGRTVFLTYPDVDDSDYWVDRRLGVVNWVGAPQMYHYPDDARVLMPPSGFQNVLVEYRAGFETIPDDLSVLARELVAQAWNTARTNGAIQSESLGDYSYTLADKATLTAGQSAMMRRWTRIGVA